jgi:arginase
VHGTVQVYPKTSVLWIDAHADLNTFETTNSKNAHGMPVSFLIRELYDGYNRKYIDSRVKGDFEPCVSAANIAYIGLRDVEESEIKLLNEFGIAHYSMRDIDNWGIQKVVEHALQKVDPNHDRALHVSVDIDSIDGPLVPNTILPTVGGLSAREVYQLGEMIHASGQLRTLDLVEINPLIGRRDDLTRTFDLANNLILAFLGKQRKQLFARFVN